MSIFQLRPEDFNPENIEAITAGTKILEIIPTNRNTMPLFLYGGELLATGFAAIPASVTTLNLSNNDLTHLYGDLSQAFAAIPTSVVKLIFAGNGLCNFSTNDGDLLTVFASIPTNITYLDLSSNSLGSHDFQIIELFNRLFAGLSRTGVKALNLSKNKLGLLTTTKLADIFAKIPPTVTEINLSGNDLENKTVTELVQIFSAIPATVEKVIINDFNTMTLEKCGLYLNFCYDVFVRHSNLNKNEAERRFQGFGSKLPAGVDGNISHNISKFLTAYDLARVHQVCNEECCGKLEISSF